MPKVMAEEGATRLNTALQTIKILLKVTGFLSGITNTCKLQRH
jgi:hypothetical protein